MPDVVVYTLPTCGYCHLLLRLLRAKGVAFREVGVRGDAAKRDWLRKTTGSGTLPQLFVDGVPHGGYTEVAALDRAGRLDALLGRTSTPA